MGVVRKAAKYISVFCLFVQTDVAVITSCRLLLAPLFVSMWSPLDWFCFVVKCLFRRSFWLRRLVPNWEENLQLREYLNI